MKDLVQIISLAPPETVPFVIIILGITYILHDVKKVKQDRVATKSERDAEIQRLHDENIKLKMRVESVEKVTELHRDKLDSIDKQLGSVNIELVRLNTQVQELVKALDRQNEIMLKQLKEKQ